MASSGLLTQMSTAFGERLAISRVTPPTILR